MHDAVWCVLDSEHYVYICYCTVNLKTENRHALIELYTDCYMWVMHCEV